MKHNNIAIFIPHLGCPHRCSFCDQNAITGAKYAPTAEEVAAKLAEAGEVLRGDPNTEVAFFGGSFTAIPRAYMLSLLTVAQKAVAEYGWKGIRISTRPDAVGEEILSLLKTYGVTAIELGAQSMDDEVLLKNQRGHTAAEVEQASSRIKAAGFELGLQMMVGLYGDSCETAIATTKKIIALAPDTVRVYPVVVMRGTLLADWQAEGVFTPMSLEEGIGICSKILLLFWEAGIQVIKFGLHASEEVEREMTGGIYHPALKELCENEIYLARAREITDHLKRMRMIRKEVTLLVHPKGISKMIGQGKKNLLFLERDTGWKCHIKPDQAVPLYEVRLLEES